MSNVDDNGTAFCLNSRRWIEFMDARGLYPKSCPNEGDCDYCGYLQHRKPTAYLLWKRKFRDEAFKALREVEK